MDKSLEKEYFDYDMKHYVKLIAPISLIFGVIFMMFIVSDYFAIKDSFSFMMVLIIRVLFITVSLIMFLIVNKVKDFTKLAYLISAYEVLAIIGFLAIMKYYGSVTLLSCFSIMAITFAIYITPNRLIYSQIISVFLSLLFFVFYSNQIVGMDMSLLLKIVAYDLIMIIYCNLGALMNNYYKRKQFLDSRELLRVSITDYLTGIYNRTKFNEELYRWIDYCNRYKKPLTLVMLDIDDFKRVNDNHGHPTGDIVLQSIAATIKKEIRSTDIFARWGGEEFTILLPHTDIHQTTEMMERVRSCIQNNKYGKVENITCSFGLVELRQDETAEAFLQRVDKLLYVAKKSGKNIVINKEDFNKGFESLGIMS